MEPHGQSPWFPKNAPRGRTSRTRGPIHPRVDPVVLLARDREVHEGLGKWGIMYLSKIGGAL